MAMATALDNEHHRPSEEEEHGGLFDSLFDLCSLLQSDDSEINLPEEGKEDALAAVEEAMEKTTQLVMEYDRFSRERSAFIDEMTRLAGAADKESADKNISNIVGSSVSSLGASLAIAGIFTGPAAVVLSPLGITLGILGAAVAGGSSFTVWLRDKSKRKQVVAIMNDSLERIKVMVDIVKDIEKLCAQFKPYVDILSKLKPKEVSPTCREGAVDKVNATMTTGSVGKGLATVTIRAVQYRAVFKVSSLTSGIDEVFSVMANASRAVSIGTAVLGSFGIVLDLINVVKSSMDLTKTSAQADEIRQSMHNLTRHIDEFDDMMVEMHIVNKMKAIQGISSLAIEAMETSQQQQHKIVAELRKLNTLCDEETQGVQLLDRTLFVQNETDRLVKEESDNLNKVELLLQSLNLKSLAENVSQQAKLPYDEFLKTLLRSGDLAEIQIIITEIEKHTLILNDTHSKLKMALKKITENELLARFISKVTRQFKHTRMESVDEFEWLKIAVKECSALEGGDVGMAQEHSDWLMNIRGHFNERIDLDASIVESTCNWLKSKGQQETDDLAAKLNENPKESLSELYRQRGESSGESLGKSIFESVRNVFGAKKPTAEPYATAREEADEENVSLSDSSIGEHILQLEVHTMAVDDLAQQKRIYLRNAIHRNTSSLDEI